MKFTTKPKKINSIKRWTAYCICLTKQGNKSIHITISIAGVFGVFDKKLGTERKYKLKHTCWATRLAYPCWIDSSKYLSGSIKEFIHLGLHYRLQNLDIIINIRTLVRYIIIEKNMIFRGCSNFLRPNSTYSNAN